MAATSQITIKDIARETGLSKSTVSRAVNTPDQVAKETLAVIQAAIARLNYIPDGNARSLVMQRSFTFAAIVPTLDNAIFAALLKSFQATLGARGYQMLVAANNYSAAQEMEQLRALAQRHIGGVLLVGGSRDAAVYEFLEQRKIACVLTSVHDGNVPSIGWDNQREAARLADLLIDLGHRRIGVLGGIRHENDRASGRIAGFHTAMRARGIEPDPALTLECAYDIPAGRAGMGRLLNLGEPPTGVLCGNDVLAFGAVLECLARGIAIPRQISITGFDDLEMAAHFHPPLTTMRSPAAEMGRGAAEMLIAANAGEPMPPSVRFDLELILRGTTGAAPGPRQA